MRKQLSRVLLSFIGVISGCGGDGVATDDLPPVSSTQAITGADGVGAPGGHEVVVVTPVSGGSMSCSGSLVRNNIVATARHCTSGAIGTIRVRKFDAAGAQTGSSVDVAAVHIASRCNEVPGLCPESRDSDIVDF